MIKKYPSPWKLNGRGYVFLYKIPRRLKREKYFIPDFAKGSDLSSLGTLMLVDYKRSTAGPYSELLFIPGKISYNNIKSHTISRIYVSTKESVYNGRENWGIPKELAEFKFIKQDKNSERIVVTVNDTIIFDALIVRILLPFPVTTRLFPIKLTQKLNNKIYFTKFNGKGIGRFARLKSIYVNPDYFPDISLVRPIAGVQVNPFSLEFPDALIESA